VLEAARSCERPPSLLYTSTNKVYGACADIPLALRGGRYIPMDFGMRESGIGESRLLEFHSPYGCAKGAADQYVLDWSRTFGVPTCVFRMSCIYGPRQFGNEDQGWVAHFLMHAMRGQRITIYGDGHQVRDVLFVDDLVDAMLLARSAMPRIAGNAFNVGGGAANAVSLLELLELIEPMVGVKPRVEFAPWRTADQRWYVSDVRKLTAALGWRPRTSVRAGIERLRAWLDASGVAKGTTAATADQARA